MKTSHLLTSFHCLLACAGMLFAMLPAAHAAGPPEAMAYQGFLVDANGDPLATNAPVNYPVIFRIFPAASGEASLWSEQQIVTVDKGNFSVILSEGAKVDNEPKPPLSAVLSTNSADRYIQISVIIGDSPPSDVLPRLRLLSSPYAFLATSANNLVSPDGVPVIRYDDRVVVTGDISASGGISASGLISGSGAGLTGLTFGQISGIFPDSQLSANVARRDVGNTFNGNQSINGNVGIRNLNPRLNTLEINPSHGIGNGWGLVVNSPAGSLGYGANIVVNNTSAIGLLIDNIANGPDADLLLIQNANASQTVMDVKGNGNVGIGTTAPAQKLHVEGSVQIAGGDLLFDNTRILRAKNAAGIHEHFLVPRHSDDRTYLNYGSGGFNIANRDGTPVMWMSSAGNVGIGTTQPAVKLDVIGGSVINLSQNNVQANGLISGQVHLIYYRPGIEPPLQALIGIRTDQAMAAAGGFYAYSDRRIKKDIKASETSEDLRAIRQLRVSDYRMVDPTQTGNSWRKGFIAQELEEILPGAVTRSTEFVPDIFSLATATKYDPATKMLTVTLSKDHGVNVGDRLRLQTDDRRQDLAVTATPSGRTFVVEQCDRAPEKVFVYGRQMNDFRTVDYDRVFTTGIGAIQELAQRLEAAKTELAEVKAKLAAQQTITVRWEARLQAMEQRLAMQAVINKGTGLKQTVAAAQ